MAQPVQRCRRPALAADGVTVVRAWMFDHEQWHGFEPAENTVNEQRWAEFDYVLYSANRHGPRVVPALENYWTAYGGVNTVLGWEGVSTANSGNFSSGRPDDHQHLERRPDPERPAAGRRVDRAGRLPGSEPGARRPLEGRR